MKINQCVFLFFAVLLTSGSSLLAQTTIKEIIYVGTYSQRDSKGIYVLEFNRSSGEMTLVQTISTKKNSNFLAVHPSGKFLFSVNHQGLDQMPDWGSISSYAIDQLTGKLSLINEQPSYGKGPCHIGVYPTGSWIFVSNYADGIFSILPITKEGKIGSSSQRMQLVGSSVDPERQTSPHPHSAIPTSDGSFLYVPDLGTDKVMIYKFDNRNGTVVPAKQPWVEITGGAGPRHFVIHPNSELAFLAEEISSTLNAFKRNPNDGTLTSFYRKCTLPHGISEQNKVADIHLNPLGTNLYVSNRGHNSIAIFDVNAETSKITYRKNVDSGGETPRNFMIEPSGHFAFVANQNSDNMVVFNIDEQGNLKQTGSSFKIPSPSCVKYLVIGQ
jgi:6-phosphogluconolactonase